MIILDFKCPNCGDISEEFVIDSEVQPLCRKCNTFKERIPSAAGMVKGNCADGRGFRERGTTERAIGSN